jgi:hypothetical protein
MKRPQKLSIQGKKLPNVDYYQPSKNVGNQGRNVIWWPVAETKPTVKQ